MRNTGPFALKASRKRSPSALTKAIRWGIERALGFHRFNALYATLPPREPSEFSGTLLAAMEIRVAFDGAGVGTIPTSGPLIVVANHPFGLVDPMALDELVLSVRCDATVMAVYRFDAIAELRDRWFFVGTRGRRRKRELSVQGWRKTLRWLLDGGAIVIFPAGNVARFDWRRGAVVDLPWSTHVAAVARRTGARVLPVYFHGRNSWASQIAGILCPPLYDLLRLVETNNKVGRSVRASLGRVIEPEELSGFASDEEATAFLRAQTEKLSSS